MSFLKSLPEADLLQIFQAFPETARPLITYHQVLLRGDSPLTAAERELIAAYVSGLIDCNFCRSMHSQIAVDLGMSPEVVAKMLSKPHKADIDPRMRPVFDFVRKLTLSPEKITRADVDAIFAAGWDDRAVHDVTAICGLFNLMSRFVDGLGIELPESYRQLAAQLAAGGYAPILGSLPEPK